MWIMFFQKKSILMAEALRGDAAPGDSSVGSNDIGSGESSTASPGRFFGYVSEYWQYWPLRSSEAWDDQNQSLQRFRNQNQKKMKIMKWPFV